MDRHLALVGRALLAPLVLATAAFHLWWGVPRAIIYGTAVGSFATSGLPPDPRPFLFVAFGLALLAGPYLVTREVLTLRQAYALGLLAMVLSIVGWVAWHATGHGAALVGREVESVREAGHHGGLLDLVAAHFRVESAEGALKTIEFTAAAIFALLLRGDPDAGPERE